MVCFINRNNRDDALIIYLAKYNIRKTSEDISKTSEDFQKRSEVFQKRSEVF